VAGRVKTLLVICFRCDSPKLKAIRCVCIVPLVRRPHDHAHTRELHPFFPRGFLMVVRTGAGAEQISIVLDDIPTAQPCRPHLRSQARARIVPGVDVAENISRSAIGLVTVRKRKPRTNSMFVRWVVITAPRPMKGAA